MRTNLIIERSILHSYPASQLLVSSGCADRLHLVEELRMYCKPRFPLHQCGFLFVLQVAQTIYTTFRTTEAATYAQIHNTDAADFLWYAVSGKTVSQGLKLLCYLSVSGGVIQRNEESWSSVTCSPNDKSRPSPMALAV